MAPEGSDQLAPGSAGSIYLYMKKSTIVNGGFGERKKLFDELESNTPEAALILD